MSGAHWQIGDLALCVTLTLRVNGVLLEPSTILRVGAVYTVRSVRWSYGAKCIAIGLNEARSRGPFGDWHAMAFRKINPLSEWEHGQFEIELMADARRQREFAK